MSVLEGKQYCSELKTVLIENHVNREIKSLDIKIYLYRCYDEHKSPSSCNTAVYLSVSVYRLTNIGIFYIVISNKFLS